MLLSTSHMTRIMAWILGTVVLVGGAALYRVFYLDVPVPVILPKPPPYVSNVPVDPLTLPDFSGGPEFKLHVDLPSLIESVRKTAETARPQIRARREEAANQFSLSGLLVPIHVKATTQRQTDDEYFQYRLQELEAYLQRTTDEPLAKEAGERFLRAYLELAAQQKGATNEETVWQLGRAALESGSRDPLIRTYCAHSQVLAGKGEEGVEQILTETLPLLSQSNYPRVIVAFVRIRLSEVGRKKDNSLVHAKSNSPPGQLNRWPAAVVAIVRWLEEEADRPQWRRSTYRRFLNAWDVGNESDKLLLLSGCVQSQKIDPWLLHTVLGDYENELGWTARGSAYADKVEQRQWKKFHEHLAHASIHLQYAWHLHPELPEPAAMMIPLAMANGDDEQNPHEWFLRTIEAQFDYRYAYVRMWNALRPRWGGSVREMLEFGKRCLETDRFDTCVPASLPDILEDIRTGELEPGETLVKDTEAQALLRLFLTRREDYRRKHPGATLHIDAPYRRTWLALMLQKCELHTEAVNEFVAMGDEVDFFQLREDGSAGAFDLALLLAAQGEVRPKVLALADTLHRSWDRLATPEAIAEAEASLKLLEPTAANPRAKLFYRHAETMLRQLRDYSAGKWVPLQFDPELLGWEVYADDWKIEKEQGAVRLSCRQAGSPRMHLRALAAFRPPFMVEADIEVLDPPPFPRMAGIQFATESLSPKTRWELRQPLFGTESEMSEDWRTKKTIRFDRANYPHEFSRQAVKMSRFGLSTVGPHRLRVKLWEHAFEFRIDDGWRAGVVAKGLDLEGGLCLGEPHPLPHAKNRANEDAGELRLSNVRIRRLDTASPPTEAATPAEQQAYWETRLVEDADDPQAHLQLAWSLYAQKQFENVGFHARRAMELCPKIEGVHGLLGRISYHAGRLQEAVAELKLSGEEMREDAIAMAIWAEILSTAPDDNLRNGERAKNLAEFAQRMSGKPQAQVLSALAAAHAELGDFEKAVEWNTRAIEIADEIEKTRLQQRHELYKANKPYRSEQ